MPRELIVSPRGEAAWAKVLGEPVAYEDNPKAWSVSLLLDPSDPETIAFVERIEAVFEEFHGPKAKIAANGWPFGDETSKDEKGRPVPTGKVKFNFKRKQETASGAIKDGPLVVDSKKSLWPQEKLIGLLPLEVGGSQRQGHEPGVGVHPGPRSGQLQQGRCG